MKLIKKLQDGMMNTDLAFGGCPICGGKNTLTNVGSTFKPCIECNACGSKFEQCSIGSPKYKMTEGSSEHLGKELTVKEWSLVRAGNLGGAAVQPLKPNQVVITSEHPADVTRDKVTSIFRRFGFEVDKTGDEYYAHKGNFITGFFIGFLLPKHDIYYSLSEAEGKTMVNLRAVVGFWKGGGVLGMYKQESAFKKIVTAISAELGHSGTGASIDKTPMDNVFSGETPVGDRFVGETTIVRKIVAAICMMFGLFVVLVGLFGMSSGMDHSDTPEMLAGVFVSAIGFSLVWFGWRHRVQIRGDTTARYIGALACIAFGLFIILMGLVGMSERTTDQPDALFGIFFIAIGIGLTWFGWSRRR